MSTKHVDHTGKSDIPTEEALPASVQQAREEAAADQATSEAESERAQHDKTSGADPAATGSGTAHRDPESSRSHTSSAETGESGSAPSTGPAHASAPAAESSAPVGEFDQKSFDAEPADKPTGASGLPTEHEAAHPESDREPAQPSAEQPGNGFGDPLFGKDDIDELRMRWREVQVTFVDDPHDAVVRARDLIAETVDKLTVVCTERTRTLENQWSGASGSDTERLRTTLRSYRDFFDRLVPH